MANFSVAKSSMKRQITTLRNQLASSSDVNDLENRMCKLETKFDMFYNEYIDSVDDNEHQELVNVENYFYDTKKMAVLKKPATDGNTFPSVTQNPIQLPKIKLPIFSGQLGDWRAFYDLFLILVHGNEQLRPVQKFQYLLSSLKDKPFELISNLQLCDENYAVAWEILTSRYNNPKLIIEHHLKQLFSLNNISDATLRQNSDSFFKHINALKALNEPSVDTLLIYLFTSHLSSGNREKWEEFIADLRQVTLNDLDEFLKKRCRILECNSTNPAQSMIKSKSQIKHSFAVTAKVSCSLCNAEHHIRKCSEFFKLDVQSRLNTCRRLRLCTNCLNSGHQNVSCNSSNCRTCGGRHHTSLHFQKRVNPSFQKTDANSQSVTVENEIDNGAIPSTSCTTKPTISNANDQTLSTNVNTCCRKDEYVLLATANVYALNNVGKRFKCRALLDNGSQSNLMTKELAEQLSLPTTKIKTVISGVGNSQQNSIDSLVNTKLFSTHSDFSIHLSFLVISQISGKIIPPMTPQLATLVSKVKLADPDICASGKIDILIGAQTFWDLVISTPTKLVAGPSLVETKLGWILSGPLKVPHATNVSTHCHISLEQQLERFWEVENVKSRSLTISEQNCEQHFVQNTTCADKFMVRLPFKSNDRELGDSYNLALKQFYNLERRFAKNPIFKKEYTDFINEYVSLGHMSKIQREEALYIMPHHGVIKESSTTTKLRVVFNASAKTSNENSLNDLLAVGPIVQDDLVDILLRFRLFRFAITADVEKMFRQIWIHPKDRKYQNILWRNNITEPVAVYQLNTVTYGTASAPFLATRCLKEVFKRNSVKYPETSSLALKSFYVDDLLGGADTADNILRLQNELSEITNQVGFNLRKWRTNCPQIETLPRDEEVNITSLIQTDDTSKTLGMMWSTSQDVFKFQSSPGPKEISKRTILSTISKMYDPLGLLAPIIIKGKLLIQNIWQQKIDWDAPLSTSIISEWNLYLDDISKVTNINIQRNVRENLNDNQLFGFCDASERAYGACVYVGTKNDVGLLQLRLLVSKSRVAPLKTISIPRLELCAATLLIELMCKVKVALNIREQSIKYFTDSTIVRAWINSEPIRHKVFVANRITQIQQESKANQWFHISSVYNPADLITRGSSIPALQTNSLWWHGPPVEHLSEDGTKTTSSIFDFDYEYKSTAVFTTVYDNYFPLMDKFSSLVKLKRVVAYCLRFFENSKLKYDKRVLGPLSVLELDSALLVLIKLAQRVEFHLELTCLQSNKTIPRTSNLLSLNPFIDTNGLLRVGGRLQLAPVSYDQKHPIILPKNHMLTRLILQHAHLRQLHGGPQSILAHTRLRYWPIHGRALIKKICRECVRCCRVKPPNLQPLMGNLPNVRVQIDKPFANSGVDYCGPFLVRHNNGRGSKSWKAYLAVFICMVTKAVHIEVVNDLSSASFISSLKRFVARRGQITNIYSDNGTNFVGAWNELKDIQSFFQNKANQTKIRSFLLEDSISWHFIPARSPHFGGLWERAIRSVKHHLVRVVGNNTLAIDEFTTLAIQIESCLNSRPLTRLSDDPNDLNFLTPGHFLVGSSPGFISEPSLLKIPTNRLDRWQHVQYMLQQFWTKWSATYLTDLQERSKWKVSGSRSLKEGDLVLIKDSNLPPLKWKMARVETLHPGKDSIVRVAKVRTINGSSKLAVRQLCPLLDN